MPTIAEESKNEKSLTNETLNGDIALQDAPIPLSEMPRPLFAPGKPIIKETKNLKSLVNDSENL